MGPARMRTGVMLAGVALAVAAAPAAAVVLPVPMVVEASRVQSFTPDLNGDGVRETILVYNEDQGTGAPTTYATVFRRVAGGWARAGTVKLFGPSPGGPTSGLVRAWAGDLNGDGRVEVMARNAITPSAGETMAIARQRGPRSLALAPLQSIPADVMGRTGPPGRSVVTALIKPNHSADGARHLERWTWSAARGRWACATDCTRGLTEAATAGYATAENAAVQGLLKRLPGNQRPISSRRRAMLRGDPLRAPNTQMWMVTFESFADLPAMPPGVYTRFVWVRKTGGRWRMIDYATGP